MAGWDPATSGLFQDLAQLVFDPSGPIPKGSLDHGKKIRAGGERVSNRFVRQRDYPIQGDSTDRPSGPRFPAPRCCSGGASAPAGPIITCDTFSAVTDRQT